MILQNLIRRQLHRQLKKSGKRHTSVLSQISGLPIVHHDGYECDLPPTHRFPMRKFTMIMEVLIKDGIVKPKKQILRPDMASEETAQLVHTTDYTQRFFNGKTTPEEQRVTGFEWSEGLASRVRYEIGGTVLASQVALQRGLACSTAGGTHHAFPDRGTGFCLLNDLAVAAREVQREGAVGKVLIVDLDVHQGDGTAAIFTEDSSVYTFSMHCEKDFPFKKQASDLDVALPKGMEDKEYLKVLTDHLNTILDEFKPELVLYDAGVDPHEADELGHLGLTDQGLLKRDKLVFLSALRRGVPVAAVVGGGYSADLQALAARHSILHRAATNVWQERRL